MSTYFGTKSFKKCDKSDDYMSPKYVWENIIDYIPKDKIIWESAYGDGESGENMRSLGLNVIHREDLDFFKDEPKEWDIQITNPPFSNKKDWFKRSKELGKPFIIVSPCSAINTKYMRELFTNELQILIPRKRINFIKKIDGKVPIDWTDRCNFDCFYFCYKMNLPKDIIWL